jgi:hypothetical protein
MSEFMPLVAPDDLPADLRAQWDATTRSGLRDFVRLMAHAPDHFRRYLGRRVRVRHRSHEGRRSFTGELVGATDESVIMVAASLANAVYEMGQQIGLVSNGRDAADPVVATRIASLRSWFCATVTELAPRAFLPSAIRKSTPSRTLVRSLTSS